MRSFISKFVLSDDLSIAARLLNAGYLIGFATCLFATITRIALFPTVEMATAMLLITALTGVIALTILRAGYQSLASFLLIFGLDFVLIPVTFFMLDGIDSGIAAYFVLSIFAIFVVVRGRALVVYTIAVSLWLVLCVYVDYLQIDFFVSLSVLHDAPPIVHFLDFIQSVAAVSFFVCTVFALQVNMLQREKKKTDILVADAQHREMLLSSINDAVGSLLTANADNFLESLDKSLRQIAEACGTHRLIIWRRGGKHDCYEYEKISGVTAEAVGMPTQFPGIDIINEMPFFDEQLQNDIILNGLAKDLFGEEAAKNLNFESILMLPLFVADRYWGIMTLTSSNTDTVFSEVDVQILRSGSVSIANAFTRIESSIQLAEALDKSLEGTRAKTAFLSTMSHEMRTPLTAIIGMTSIGKRTKDVERKDYAFSQIDLASEHLLGVINDVLDISKIEAGKLELEHAPFEFELMLRKVVSVITFRAAQKNQQLVVNLDSNMPYSLIGDSQHLAQVITNLLGNAIKFTPEDGTITIETSFLGAEEDGRCLIQVLVRDTGIGVSSEQQAKLFSSFEQADSSISRKFGGTGLGLSISKSIIELMDGEIWVESELGKGSTFGFRVRLPQGSLTPPPSHGATVDWTALKALIVDDDPAILEYFSAVAQEINLRHDTANSGQKALELVESAQDEPYNLFFVDWRMPGMGGLELALALRERDNPEEKPVTIIMISAAEWETIAEEAASAGINDFLPKPLFPSAIVDRINECFNTLPVKPDANDDEELSFAGHTILVAEDVEVNREIVSAMLDGYGLTIDFAVNGREAVRLYTDNPEIYDMIFMDVQMPEMNGHQATGEIRDWAHLHGMERVPIVAMTANVFKEDVDRCLEAGMDGHIGKPIDLMEILAILKQNLLQASA